MLLLLTEEAPLLVFLVFAVLFAWDILSAWHAESMILLRHTENKNLSAGWHGSLRVCHSQCKACWEYLSLYWELYSQRALRVTCSQHGDGNQHWEYDILSMHTDNANILSTCWDCHTLSPTLGMALRVILSLCPESIILAALHTESMT